MTDAALVQGRHAPLAERRKDDLVTMAASLAQARTTPIKGILTRRALVRPSPEHTLQPTPIRV